jgi:hypothetical protein
MCPYTAKADTPLKLRPKRALFVSFRYICGGLCRTSLFKKSLKIQNQKNTPVIQRSLSGHNPHSQLSNVALSRLLPPWQNHRSEHPAKLYLLIRPKNIAANDNGSTNLLFAHTGKKCHRPLEVAHREYQLWSI